MGAWVCSGSGSAVVRVLGIMESLAEVGGSLHSLTSAEGDWGCASWARVGWVCSGSESVVVVIAGSVVEFPDGKVEALVEMGGYFILWITTWSGMAAHRWFVEGGRGCGRIRAFFCPSGVGVGLWVGVGGFFLRLGSGSMLVVCER